jgi:threonine dehydrogenase-like Zn-dependent dehydrogenase
VACVSGFFGGERVTIPMEAWNYGVMEKFLTGVLANAGRDYLERLLLLIATRKLDTAPLATLVLHGWDKLEEGSDPVRSRYETVIKPVIVI